MIKSVSFILMIWLGSSFLFAQDDLPEKQMKATEEIAVVCCYFPSYHTRDKNDLRISNLHWENWSEWELVEQACPDSRIPQPCVPA